jgi:SCY1-like protein 1
MFPAFKKLLNPNPKARFSVKAFLETGMGESQGEGEAFFANNRLVKVCMSLDNFNLASEGDKSSLLRFVLRILLFIHWS